MSIGHVVFLLRARLEGIDDEKDGKHVRQGIRRTYSRFFGREHLPRITEIRYR